MTSNEIADVSAAVAAEPVSVEGAMVQEAGAPVVAGEVAPVVAEAPPIGDLAFDLSAKPADAPVEAQEGATAENPADHAPVDAAVVAEAAEAAAREPVTYDLKIPDGFEVRNPERMTAFQGVLGQHGVPQEAVQGLLELHAQVMKENLDAFQSQMLPKIQEQALAQASQEAAKRLDAEKEARLNTWRAQIAADPELGGSGHKTVSQNVSRVRDALVRPEHRAEFNDFIKHGGGNHPAFWRLLNNTSSKIFEPQSNRLAVGAPVPGPKGGLRSLYGTNRT